MTFWDTMYHVFMGLMILFLIGLMGALTTAACNAACNAKDPQIECADMCEAMAGRFVARNQWGCVCEVNGTRVVY